MKVSFPADSYVKNISINDAEIEIYFSKRKNVALLFICLNDRYWPYIAQVIKDCRKNFLPQHKIDFFLWTDYTPARAQQQVHEIDSFVERWQTQEDTNAFLNTFVATIRLYSIFYLPIVQQALNLLAQKGIILKVEGNKFWIEAQKPIDKESIILIGDAFKTILRALHADLDETLKGVHITETDAIEWPAPTLMRYHLFLNQKEQLSSYQHIFYMDADMRVVDKISDEVLTRGLLAAEHPMYSLKTQLIPPYEPNPKSKAYIKRPGKILDENGKTRFRPYYIAGGFQGGETKPFIKAMEVMKKNIDYDFDRLNYTAIWNDESHWNKYVFEHYKGNVTVLSPAYIYPDSLIKEYYEPIWGRSYEPKIITLTKPFSLSSQGGEDIQKMIDKKV